MERTEISLMTEYSMHREMGYGVTCTAAWADILLISSVNELWNTNSPSLSDFLLQLFVQPVCVPMCLSATNTNCGINYYSRVVFILLRAFHRKYLTASTIHLCGVYSVFSLSLGSCTCK